MTTATKNPVQYENDDPFAAAMNPEEGASYTGPKTYFGEMMHIEAEFVGYNPQTRRFEAFDSSVHDRRSTRIVVRIAPLKTDFQPVERDFMDYSVDWKKTMLPSLIALGINAQQLRGQFVQYEMRPTGEIYLKLENVPSDIKRNLTKEAQQLWTAAGGKVDAYNAAVMRIGRDEWITATKERTAPYILAVYGSRDECQQAADTFFTSRRDRDNTPAPTPAPSAPSAAPQASNDQLKAFALRSVGLKWEMAGGQVGKWDSNVFAKFEGMFNSDPSVTPHVKLTDPEVIAITGNPF